MYVKEIISDRFNRKRKRHEIKTHYVKNLVQLFGVVKELIFFEDSAEYHSKAMEKIKDALRASTDNIERDNFKHDFDQTLGILDKFGQEYSKLYAKRLEFEANLVSLSMDAFEHASRNNDRSLLDTTSEIRAYITELGKKRPARQFDNLSLEEYTYYRVQRYKEEIEKMIEDIDSKCRHYENRVNMLLSTP